MSVQEPDGFRDYVAARWSALLRTAWLLTGDWALAEDLLQTALAKTWRRWPSLQRTDQPDAYVKTVMVNTLFTWRRRKWRGEYAYADVPEHSAPDAALGEIESRDRVHRLLRDLPPRQRAVLVLRYVEDFSEQQTADALGCSVGTVKSQAARALSRLRDEGLLRMYEVDGR